MTSTGPTYVTGWRQRAGGALFLVTGVALVIHLLIGLPLWLTVLGSGALAASVYLWLGVSVDAVLSRRIRIGLVTGAAATACYDVSRFAYVALTDTSIRPYAAWRLFGAALIGGDAPAWAEWTVGTAFHITNGLLFAVAYTISFAPRGPLWGVGYALVLEVFMLGLFPGWLNVKAIGEFTTMSVLGHLVYGSVLGATAKRLTPVAAR